MLRRPFLLLLIVICARFNGVHSQMTMDETFEFFRGLADICYKKFPVDMKVLTDVNEGRFADDAENLMCFITCTFESMRFTRKGKYDANRAIKFIKMYAPAESTADWVRGAELCGNEKGGENTPCEQSYIQAKCFAKNNDQFLVPIPGLQKPS